MAGIGGSLGTIRANGSACKNSDAGGKGTETNDALAKSPLSLAGHSRGVPRLHQPAFLQHLSRQPRGLDLKKMLAAP